MTKTLPFAVSQNLECVAIACKTTEEFVELAPAVAYYCSEPGDRLDWTLVHSKTCELTERYHGNAYGRWYPRSGKDNRL